MITIEQLTPDQATTALPELVGLLQDSIESGASVQRDHAGESLAQLVTVSGKRQDGVPARGDDCGAVGGTQLCHVAAAGNGRHGELLGDQILIVHYESDETIGGGGRVRGTRSG